MFVIRSHHLSSVPITGYQFPWLPTSRLISRVFLRGVGPTVLNGSLCALSAVFGRSCCTSLYQHRFFPGITDHTLPLQLNSKQSHIDTECAKKRGWRDRRGMEEKKDKKHTTNTILLITHLDAFVRAQLLLLLLGCCVFLVLQLFGVG